jgi:uncharacterized protein (TIGR02452 family)
MNREKRVSLAQETVDILSKGHYTAPSGRVIDIAAELERAVSGSRLYRGDDFPGELKSVGHHQTFIEVTSETTLEAARRVASTDSNPLCLNYASARNPGGGFLSGAQAQEESLARSSGLYPCIVQMAEMYEHNRRLTTCLYSDLMIYSPGVPVFRQDSGHLLENPFCAGFITAPAVNAGAVRRNERAKTHLIRSVMETRLLKVLWLAAEHEHSALILGAWGCGVFDNDPQMIAGLFADALDGPFYHRFERIVFAVYDRSASQKDFRAFQNRFAAVGETEKQ